MDVMATTKRQFWFLEMAAGLRLKFVLPVVSGCIMLASSVFPWLVDPVQGNFSAWQLPIDIGWQLHTSYVSYGLLCLLCAIFAFLVAAANITSFKGSSFFSNKHSFAALFCLAPVLLFFLQYLTVDMVGVDVLAQHKVQMILLQRHLGYSLQADRLRIDPYTFTDATVLGRLLLLADQISFGILLPLAASWFLYDYRRIVTTLPRIATNSSKSRYLWLAVIGLFLLIVFGRGPISTVCDFKAKQSLSSGDYSQALNWLYWAQVMNPSLLQVASFHIDRGEALYFLHPDQSSDDSRVFLGATYRNNKDFLDSYQELLGVWQANPTSPWVTSEIGTTIERLSEFTTTPNGLIALRADNDDTALIWVQLLSKVDPTNTYGQYMNGFILYDLHDYNACITQMNAVLSLRPNNDIKSSAITYIALSDIREGHYNEGRNLLFQAVKLDPNYRNNTAREALSGLY